MMMTNLVVKSGTTIYSIAAVMAQTFPDTSILEGSIWLQVPPHGGPDFDSVSIKELTYREALDEWYPESPIMRDMFNNPYLGGPSIPFYVILRSARRPNRLFPAVVRCLSGAGVESVIVGPYSLHRPAHEYLRRLDQDPRWEWDREDNDMK